MYVFDLILDLKRNVGFKFIEEYCWIKRAFPGNLRGRFKNAFEPVYHFTKSAPEYITFNPLACGSPIKKETITRANRKQEGIPDNGSRMEGINWQNIKELKLSRPSNVIEVHNVSNQYTLKSQHPATFPEGLVDFFIRSFSNKGDVVLDPFAGSGTTGVVCIKTNRDYILIEKESRYIDLIRQRLGKDGN